MGKKTRVALVANYDENWIGGVYYIYNIINAFLSLDVSQRPEITIVGSTETFKVISEKFLDYSFSHVSTQVEYTVLEKLVNKIWHIFTRKHLFEKRPKGDQFDLVYPAPKEDFFSLLNNKVGWIPDFQEKHLPQLFSTETLQSREKYNLEIANNQHPMVFSSQNALNDYKRFYPQYKNKTLKVVHFRVSLDLKHPKSIPLQSLLEKFSIPEDYILCSNQVWVHKNHKTVLQALKISKQQGKKAYVVFTGKNHDPRNPEYFEELNTIIKNYEIQDYCKFLGFIDRDEQLSLALHSKAVLQPSLFEGWNTSIEDAKFMNKFILASNIDIHKEQLNEYRTNYSLFKKDSPIDLFENLERIRNQPLPTISFNYSRYIQSFAKDLLSLSEDLN